MKNYEQKQNRIKQELNMLRKIIVQMIFIFALIFPYELGKADHCDICLVDECYAAFESGPDGDSMTDELETDLAKQLNPALYLEKMIDNWALEEYV
jgi:hypothetical protein